MLACCSSQTLFRSADLAVGGCCGCHLFLSFLHLCIFAIYSVDENVKSGDADLSDIEVNITKIHKLQYHILNIKKLINSSTLAFICN